MTGPMTGHVHVPLADAGAPDATEMTDRTRTKSNARFMRWTLEAAGTPRCDRGHVSADDAVGMGQSTSES
jgi:hypothetical protein